MSSRVLFIRLLPPVIILLAFIFFIYEKPLQLLYDKNYKISFYSDSSQGGNSQIHNSLISDTAVYISFTLRKGYPFPYAGIGLEAKTFFPDFSRYDYIDLDLSTEKSRSVQFFLNTNEPGITKDSIPITYRYVLYEVPAKHSKGIQRLWLSEFKTPVWWYPLVNLSEKDLKEPHFDKIKKLSFSNGILLPINVRDSITIREITLGKNYVPFFTGSSISLALYYTVLALVGFYRKKLSNVHSKVIPYQKLEIQEGQDQSLNKIVNYLSKGYSDPELTLSGMAEELGMSPRKISDHIKVHFNLSFKQYINSIRLNEARRLLKETNLPINEIAYKVGFNNVTHFNRAFKQYCNCSPQEFRSEQ